MHATDRRGWTPIAHAAQSPQADVETLQILLAYGAKLDAATTRMPDIGMAPLAFALNAGNLDKVRCLLDAGADLHYSRRDYGALLDAVHGRDIVRDTGLMPLLVFLIEHGARLNDITRYRESALRVLSGRGRFDAVKRLLVAGADKTQLQMSPLIEAVAIGNLDDMSAVLEAGADLEARDFWERTPLLVAFLTGDIAKVNLLLKHGVNRDAVGRCAHPPLFYAIDGHHDACFDGCFLWAFPLDRRTNSASPRSHKLPKSAIVRLSTSCWTPAWTPKKARARTTHFG